VILVLLEPGEHGLTPPSRQACTFARSLGEQLGSDEVAGVLVGDEDDDAIEAAGAHGVDAVHVLVGDLLEEYGPEAWAAALQAAIDQLGPSAVVVPGSDRGNEVLAGVAARADLPMVANVTAVEVGDDGLELTRVRWGGSLTERCRLVADLPLLSMQPHAVEAVVVGDDEPDVEELDVDVDPALARSTVVERTTTSTGMTLATAPVVVGGGRGVGSADGFAPLERLAELLGGVVGCSRVVTNAGWRPHSDQVGQTGTAIAPEVYIACGISGAIQHWAGAKSAKHVLAINTDPDANMVAKADWAVVGDLHDVVPAIIAEIESR
jgi:electron transfer flavoprotein alpha subunit